jgi:hypothetical protein
MKNQTRWIVLSIVLTAVALLTAISVRAAPSAPSAPVGTGFTYQGKLEDESGPVSASCDMEFRLYSHATNPSQVGSTIAATVPISNGLFTVELDFGTSAFDGEGRWLGIQVSCPGDSGFTDLGRQELTAAPYALYALRVGPHEHWGESWTGTGTGLSLSGGTSGVYGSGSISGVEGYSGSGSGVFGEGATGVSGTSDSGYGVHGVGITAGVYGTSDDGPGVRGISYASGGASIGVSGAGSAYGVHGTGSTGVYGTSVAGYGVQGNSADNHAIYGTSSASGHAGVRGSNSNSYGYGVEGEGSTAGVYGHSTSSYGVHGEGSIIGVYGYSASGDGVSGYSESSTDAGVYGYNTSGDGVSGYGDDGVYGSGYSSGVHGFSATGTGVRGFSNTGAAISAEGSGVITSTADSFLYLSPHAMVIRQDNPGLISATPQPGGSMRIRNESGTGTRYLSIPVSTFGKLFGAQVYVESLTVCYKVTGPSVGYISATTVSKNDGTGTAAHYIYDVTTRNSTSYACYGLQASTPRVPIDSSTWIQFNMEFTGSGSGSDIYVYSVELTLTEQQN